MKRAAFASPSDQAESGALVVKGVTFPTPDFNLPSDWRTRQNAYVFFVKIRKNVLTRSRILLSTAFIGGDGNFQLYRFKNGGGPISDPSLFGDLGTYSPEERYQKYLKDRDDDGQEDGAKVRFCLLHGYLL